MNNSFNVNPDGSFLFCEGLITFGPDGKFIANKLGSKPDGSLQLGDALTIDSAGFMTLDGGTFTIKNSYDLIFEGGGPVMVSPDGGKFKLVVDNAGVVSTVPV